ncbi:MAG: hypothetical protein GC134_06330 [Proteobacteria bacterium]|nr:hypothetical protein [Pseudomonadota bacterium]
MTIKVNDSKSVSSTSKKKKTSGAAKSGEGSFASMIDSASATGAAEATTSLSSVGGVAPRVYEDAIGDDVPRDARGRSSYLLEKLDDLQKDILAGDPTVALEKIRHALATEAIDRNELPPKVRALMDEIDMRASVEIAKAEVGKKRSV